MKIKEYNQHWDCLNILQTQIPKSIGSQLHWLQNLLQSHLDDDTAGNVMLLYEYLLASWTPKDILDFLCIGFIRSPLKRVLKAPIPIFKNPMVLWQILHQYFVGLFLISATHCGKSYALIRFYQNKPAFSYLLHSSLLQVKNNTLK